MGNVNREILWKLLFSFTLSLSMSIRNVSSERILFLLPLSMNSHKIFFEPLVNGLAARGHEVTVLTNDISNKSLPVVKELVAIPNEDFMKGYPQPFENLKSGNRKMAFPFDFILEGCHKVIQSQAFRGVLRQEFDVIIVDSFLTGCLDGFIYKSGAPFILVTTMPAPSYISERVGNFLPPSIIPVLSYRGYGEPSGEMDFLQRLGNFVHFALARIYVNWVILPSLEKVYRQYLGNDVPGILEIESKASMIFMNSHFTMNFPRPLLPAVVEIGGMHCGGGNAVPSSNTTLEKFISKEASPHGFIYFSVGSIIDLDNAPAAFIHTLMTIFSRLEQRVVVKWKRRDGKRISWNMARDAVTTPNNVWISDWFSQQDILAHENIRLFISHGGLLSLQEAVYYGVPVLGIPFGMDQDTNIHNAVLQGYALKLDANGLNKETLNSSINEILTNPKYLQNAQRISNNFRQRPISPLDTALFWTEYLMSAHKQNSTHYMASPARQLSIIQYYSFDILAFLMISLVAVAYMIRRSIFVIHELINIVKEAVSAQRKKVD